MIPRHVVLLALNFAAWSGSFDQLAEVRAGEPVEKDVFVSGTEGYHTFRIPAVIAAPNGTLVAFAEGRKRGRGDSGDIDLVYRRSTDGGMSWGAHQVLWNDGENTCGNPCPVVDRSTGRIWLLATWNLGSDDERQIMAGTSRDTRRVYVTSSVDGGATWTSPRNITSTVKRRDWRWYATGPGNGIQLSRGLYRGRMIIPCDHSDHSSPGRHPFRSHVVYSDDHGVSWRLGGVLDEKTNECAVVECSDGSLLLNMRSYHGKHRRATATSQDGGITWSATKLDHTLVEPVCQASLLRLSSDRKAGRSRLLFSNPASTQRKNLTVRLSYDDGRSWPISKVIHAGAAAYSSLVVLRDGNIGCLYEKDGYRRIVFTTFSLEWLTDGDDPGD